MNRELLKERKRVEQQIENILVAQAMIADIPKSHIAADLDFWALKPAEHGRYPDERQTASEKDLKELHCGSAACFGGWCAVHPYFKRQGIRRDPTDGSPVLKRVGSSVPSDAAELLFGDSNAFAQREYHEKGHGSDKQVIARRLKKALNYRLEELRELDDVDRLDDAVQPTYGVRGPYRYG